MVVVSMEMCVQNLYPRRSLELPGIREKLSLNYEPLKRGSVASRFPSLSSPVFRPTNPFFRRRFVPARESRAGAMYPGLQVQGNEFPHENTGVMDTSARCLAFHRAVQSDARHPATTPVDVNFASSLNSTSRYFIVWRGLRHAVSAISPAEYLTGDANLTLSLCVRRRGISGNVTRASILTEKLI